MDKASWHHLLHRRKEAHKYDFGHVLIVGGSQAMVGAAVLAARAALRTGAGLVTIASSHETIELIDRDIEEIMTVSLPSWSETEKCLEKIKSFVRKRHISTVIVGPGLPQAADMVIRDLIMNIKLPMVVDAEAFSALSNHLDILISATHMNSHMILTPHPGEYARLIGDESWQKDSDERRGIGDFARKYHVTLVMKHHKTLVANEAGEIYENTTGNPGLATAGTGDVLSGIIAGLLAQKIESYEAATMAVYLHGMTADIVVESKTEPGMIASDIIEAIPTALQRIEDTYDSKVMH